VQSPLLLSGPVHLHHCLGQLVPSARLLHAFNNVVSSVFVGWTLVLKALALHGRSQTLEVILRRLFLELTIDLPPHLASHHLHKFSYAASAVIPSHFSLGGVRWCVRCFLSLSKVGCRVICRVVYSMEPLLNNDLPFAKGQVDQLFDSRDFMGNPVYLWKSLRSVV
jgi:hypothetical protein